ncbi:MAG: hypothetical protein IKR04_01060 [Clostridia bacterium]|nr:hypothetical protein [Clostridia bacterium]
MRKTKLLVGFVLFCIVLSFFSVAFAEKITFLPNSECYSLTPSEGGPRYSENTFRIKNPGGTTRSTFFKCNQTGVYTISLTLKDGKACPDYCIYNASSPDWRDTPETQFASLACYKDGESYVTFSPQTASSDTTVKVYLYAGREYRVDNWRSEGELEIYYSPSDNSSDKEVYDSGISSRYRTCVNCKDNCGHDTVVDGVPDGGDVESPEDERTTVESTESLFEYYLVQLLLSIGDFFVKLLGDIIGSDVTITKIIYNGAGDNKIPALNPNLFDKTNASSFVGIDISQVVSDWYNFFRGLAFLFYVVTLLGIGIHILINSTGQGMAKAKSLAIEWSKGVLLLIFMPVFIKFLFEINEALVKMVYEKALGNTYNAGEMLTYTDGSEWSATAVEFRSPEYVSKYTGSVALGSEEASIAYVNKLSTYRQSFDLMRIARAYAGATRKIGYSFIWYVLIGQLMVFIVMYYKRFFTILFLIAAFPVICIFHAISLLKGMNKAPEISSWFKKIVEQIFVQSIHAVVYALITGVCLTMFKSSISGNNAGINWLLMIVAINFVPEGEKILKRILNSIGGSGGGLAEQGKGLKGAIGRVTNGARKLVGRPPKE